MPSTTHINLPTAGIVSDLSLLNMDSKYYSFALNAVIADKDGQEPSLQNEMSNICAVQFPEGYKVVGFREIPEQKRTIYLLTNPLTGMGQVGEVHNCANIKDRTDRIEKVYCKDCTEYISPELPSLEQQLEKCYCTFRSIAPGACLGFDINYPVDIEYRITSCSLNIYFTDALNERRYMYFDYENDDINGNLVLQDAFKIQTGVTGPCDTPVYSDEIDCEKIKVHPKYNRVCIDFLNFVNGGNLKEGSYQVLVALADAYGNTISSYFPSTQIAPLFRKQITVETNLSTASALHFKITNLPTTGYYNLVIAETVDSFTQLKHVGTFPTTQTEYTYTGFENTIKVLAPSEVFFRYPYYRTARSVTKANNYLFYSDVKSYKLLNLQPVANAIILRWQTVALKEGAYSNPYNTFNFRSEQRDEVVPYGVVFEMDNGQETCVFHIPGRASIPSDLTLVSNNHPDYIPDFDCATNLDKPKWKLYNTATVTSTPHEYNPDCDGDKCWESGTFSYWESTDRYPNIPEVWGSLCNQPIRHHKYPDSCISHIHDSLNGTKTFNENNYIFPIGVQVDHQSVIDAIAQAVTDDVITQEDADRIVSYRIVRGNRLGNKSIIAKGLFYNMWHYDKFGIQYLYPNYAYNDLRQDFYIAPSNNFGGSNTSDPDPVQPDHVHYDKYTFHSPDTHFVQPELGTYVKMETEEYGQSEGYFTYSDCEAKHKLLSTAARVLAFGLGLAAALSATSKKDCRVVTYKSDYKINQEDTTDSSTFDGIMPVPYIHGSFTSGSGSISTDIIYGSYQDAPHTIVHGEITEEHNFQNAKIFDDCGDEITDTEDSETYTKNYCRGLAWQFFNCNVIIGGVLGTFIGIIASIVQRTILGIIEMDKVITTMRELIPYKNYGIQYNSVGKYNNYKCSATNNKNRVLLRSAYLEPIMQSINETSTVPNSPSTTVRINNWHRESSVYLKTNTSLAAPTVIDTSRFTMNNIGFGYGDLNRTATATISSFYGSIKRDIPNQYGQLCNIDYLEAGNCSFFLNTTYAACETKVFGGDTFINRFSLKRKMPFWTQTRCGAPNGTDVKYSELSNVGFPNHYFNVEQPLAEKLDSIGGGGGILTILQDLIGTADSRFDARTNKFFYQNGYMHLYHYGIPSFIVESDINLDYRHGENTEERDFYPHNTDLKTWFEEANVPIKWDNFYFYNRTYSKQNHETPNCRSCIRTLKDLTCNTHDDNLVIYSEQNEQDRKSDNWLVFKANNFWNFPLTLGKVISVDGIEDDKILVRQENAARIYNAYNTIQATPENISVGTGGIFAGRPQEFANTDLGYAGTQHRDILHTEFGHIWGDAERGSIINITPGGTGMDELTRYGTRHWFKENMPFQIKKDFPLISNEDLDNNLKGIGLHFCFDKRFSRILVTKLDYKVLDPTVQYDTDLHIFYIVVDEQPVEVKLYDPRYFCNKSWTRSFNFKEDSKGWTSFHTYTPNFYVEHVNGFESGINKLAVIDDVLDTKVSTYYHNASNKSYQVFYGKLQPFIVELIGKQSIENNYMNNFEFSMDTIRYHNEFDAYYNNNVTFNKAIIYNEHQCSGMLNLIPNDHDDLSQLGEYPKLTDKGFEILTTNSENVWSFNDFGDYTASAYNKLPYFIYDCANVNKVIDNRAMDYTKNSFNVGRIRAKASKIRLINDATSLYKMILNFGITQQNKSTR